MKTFFFILFSISSIIVNAQDYIIKPQIGIDNLIFGRAKLTDVKEHFTAIEFEEKFSGALGCGNAHPIRSSLITLVNDSLGIEIKLSSDWYEGAKKKEETLSTIIFKKNLGHFDKNDIMVGKSNYTSVQEKYGKAERESDFSLVYERLGLFFIFDKEKKLIRMEIEKIEKND